MRTLSRHQLRPRSAENAMTLDLANSYSPVSKRSDHVTKCANTKSEIHMCQGHHGRRCARYKSDVCSAPIAYWFSSATCRFRSRFPRCGNCAATRGARGAAPIRQRAAPTCPVAVQGTARRLDFAPSPSSVSIKLTFITPAEVNLHYFRHSSIIYCLTIASCLFVNPTFVYALIGARRGGR